MRNLWIILSTVVLLDQGNTAAASEYSELVALYRDVQAASQPRLADGLPGLSPEALLANRRAYQTLRQRFDAVEPTAWPRAHRIDYLLVRSVLDEWDFEHRIVKNASRNPGYYLSGIVSMPYIDLPAGSSSLDALGVQLRAIPSVLARAKQQLGDRSPVLSRLTIRNLELDVGVWHGEPRRGVPGVIGWFRDLEARLFQHHPELAADAQAARIALESYRDWLQLEPGDATQLPGLGRDAFDQYLRRVRLSPFTAQQILEFVTQELQRIQAMLAWERHRNRHLPELEPVSSPEEYARRKLEAEQHIRSFIVERDILTVPEGISELTEARERSYPWFARPSGKRNFWEEIQHRDPRPDLMHTVIPGHAFDDRVRTGPTPIRENFRDRDGREGWSLYAEEMLLRAGLLDDLPRTRELVLSFLIGRAARCIVNVRLQLNEINVEEGVRFLVDNVPFNAADGYRIDAELYDMFRSPTYAMNWYLGKVQIDRLVAERSRELGDEFELHTFHDAFLSSGAIPIALVRWEMTGLEDEIATLWSTRADRQPE